MISWKLNFFSQNLNNLGGNGCEFPLSSFFKGCYFGVVGKGRWKSVSWQSLLSLFLFWDHRIFICLFLMCNVVRIRSIGCDVEMIYFSKGIKSWKKALGSSVSSSSAFFFIENIVLFNQQLIISQTFPVFLKGTTKGTWDLNNISTQFSLKILHIFQNTKATSNEMVLEKWNHFLVHFFIAIYVVSSVFWQM